MRGVRTALVVIGALGLLRLTMHAESSSSDAFYRAIRANDLLAIDALIASGGDVNARGVQGITPLMDAASLGSVDAMRRLIAAGASVDARNDLGATALMWAVREMPKVRLLVEQRADVNASSKTGRTPLLLAAMSDESADVVRFLMAKGADTRATDRVGMTALHAAANANDTETVRLLLDASPDVNAKDAGDFTPLMNAAMNGNTAVARMLLARGARARDVSGRGDMKTHTAAMVKNGRVALSDFTALHIASVTGPPELVKLLIDAGADLEAREGRGMTPLVLSVAADHANPEIVKLLMSAGASLDARDPSNETALDWAQKYGNTTIVAALKKAGAPSTAAKPATVPAAAPVALEPALARSVALLEKTSGEFFARGGCAACHAQNITDVVAGATRGKSVGLSDQAAAARLTATKARYFSSIAHLLERQDLAGTPDVPTYSMLAFANAGYAADRITDAVAVNIAAQQLRDGRWHLGGVVRPPMQDGDIARTALAIRALTAYAPPGRSDVAAQIVKARRWLEHEPATTGDDRNFALLGLKWANADAGAISRAAQRVLAAQRPDGGWAQRDELASDAYATGQALYAVATANPAATGDPAFRRGIAFLLASQRADGSWYVASRAIGFQPYFESGFPYGRDQWISSMATGWAAGALALAAR